MTWGSPAALYLLLLGPGIVLLYFLRARSRQFKVSALFLWKDLPRSSKSRAARLRRRLEPLLLLQLLAVVLLSLALANPTLSLLRSQLPGLAIVLDSSASMYAGTTSEKSRYEIARQAALELVRKYPTTPTSVFQLCRRPNILASSDDPHQLVEERIGTSNPSWFGDGTAEMLKELLGTGGSEQQRVIVYTDHDLPGLQPGIEQVVIGGAPNVAVTGFAVRSNPNGRGVTAFVRVRNGYDDYQEVELVVTDQGHEIRTSLFIPGSTEQSRVLPFPISQDRQFVASIEPHDAFAADDTRFCTLSGSSEVVVRWVGEQNHYLMAALQASRDILLVPDSSSFPADLTVCNDTTLPANAGGNILLIHADWKDHVEMGAELDVASIVPAAFDDMLLTDVDPGSFYVETVPEVQITGSSTTILQAGDSPFLLKMEEDDRRIVVLTADLMRTNLPLTVDFPLLVGNIVAYLSPTERNESIDWTLVGDPIHITGYPGTFSIETPSGKRLPIAGDVLITPERPGIYTLYTVRGTFPVAVNVDVQESVVATPSVTSEPIERDTQHAELPFPLWPYVGALGILCLAGELTMYEGWGSRILSRRKR